MIDQLKRYTLFENRTIEAFELLENQGYCNENYLIQSEEKKYILRKFIRADVDRKFEFEVQKLAYEIGISAEPLLLDEENALSISGYLEGRHKEKLGKGDLEEFAEVLKKVHSLKIERDPIVLETLFETKTKAVQDAFALLKHFPSEFVLCHNDLNQRNLLFTEKIRLIDWEDSGINDRYFDLASACVEFNLDKENEAHLLRCYFTAEEEINDEKLKAYKTIYKALCPQWLNDLEKKKKGQQLPDPHGE